MADRGMYDEVEEVKLTLKSHKREVKHTLIGAGGREVTEDSFHDVFKVTLETDEVLHLDITGTQYHHF